MEDQQTPATTPEFDILGFCAEEQKSGETISVTIPMVGGHFGYHQTNGSPVGEAGNSEEVLSLRNPCVWQNIELQGTKDAVTIHGKVERIGNKRNVVRAAFTGFLVEVDEQNQPLKDEAGNFILSTDPVISSIDVVEADFLSHTAQRVHGISLNVPRRGGGSAHTASSWKPRTPAQKKAKPADAADKAEEAMLAPDRTSRYLDDSPTGFNGAIKKLDGLIAWARAGKLPEQFANRELVESIVKMIPVMEPFDNATSKTAENLPSAGSIFQGKTEEEVKEEQEKNAFISAKAQAAKEKKAAKEAEAATSTE